MVQIMSAAAAVALVQEGDSVAIAGFLTVGTPLGLVDALVARGTTNLDLIVNDTGYPDRGVGKLIVNRQARSLIASHIGTNPETGRQMVAGELKVELNPQGTLVERLRAGGTGLGGFLTPVGVGTLVEEGKQKLSLDGREYLLERPLTPKFGFVKAFRADKKGNLVYRKAARNFNPAVAAASEITIAEVDEVVESGMLDPESIITPWVFVQILVPRRQC
ncbi:MAG: CoA transferase subunit A [Nitrospinae bacterium]|nr:CoA transferase subunit A [Nitrospinota bacterium]